MSIPQDPLAHVPPPDSGPPLETGDVMSRANLVVVGGPLAGRVFPLVRTETLIGRVQAAQIRLEDKAISTRHAKILQTQDGHALIDLGSTNGTFLNGRQLKPNQPYDLSPGDSVQFSETVLAYLPPGSNDPQEQTHYLSKLVPQVAQSSALRLHDTNLPDAQLLAQLLQMAPVPAEPPEPPPVTIEERIEQLKRAWALVRRNWLTLFVCAAICALIGNATVFLKPPLAQASFRIRVAPPKEKNDDDRDHRQFYAATEQSFLTPKLAQQTLIDLGAIKPSKGRVDYELKQLDFDSIATATYEGKYLNKDPVFAVRFLSRYLENFLTAELSKILEVQQAEVNFLTTRVAERENELRNTEEELKEFKQKHLEGLPEFASNHVVSRETLLNRRAELGAQLAKANLELQLARKRQQEGAPVLTKKLDAAAPFEQGLLDVRKKLAEARAKGLGDQHPEVVTLTKQANDFQRMADQAKSSDMTDLERGANTGLNALKDRVGDLEVMAKGTGAELGAVNEQLKRLDKLVGVMPEVEARYAQLTRDYTVNKELHAKLFQQLKTAQLTLELERTSAKARYEIVRAPEAGGVQLRKILAQRTLMGIGAGLALGALIAAILEFRRFLRSRRTPGTAIVVAGNSPRA